MNQESQKQNYDVRSNINIKTSIQTGNKIVKLNSSKKKRNKKGKSKNVIHGGKKAIRVQYSGVMNLFLLRNEACLVQLSAEKIPLKQRNSLHNQVFDVCQNNRKCI